MTVASPPVAGAALRVRATPHQPLSLGVGPTGTAPTPTHHYVPGSVLRGALAARWIRDHGLPLGNPRQEEFVALFEGSTRFGPLLAEGSYVLPMSVLVCKYGRCPDTADQAFDEPGERCACGPLEPAKGGILGANVIQRTHVELDPDSGTARNGQLFTRRSLRATALTGTIHTSHDLPPGARTWLRSQTRVHLGGRRSTSGATTLSLSDQEPAAVEPRSRRLALMLRSPAILTDPCGLPLDLADPAAVKAALHDELGPLLQGSTIDDVQVWARYETAGGWHAASGLPKPVELTAGPGSVIRLDLAAAPAADQMAAIARRGLGLRRAEGFGHLEIRSEPWRRPARLPGDEPEPEASPDQHDAVLVDLLTPQDPKIRSWLLGLLIDITDELAAGTRPVGLLERRAVRGLPTATRERLRALIEPVDTPLGPDEVEAADQIRLRYELAIRLGKESR